MSEHVILVDKRSYWKESLGNYPIASAAEYLTGADWQLKKGIRVVNLSRTQRYLGEGYYCSLLAEARAHKIIPTVRSIRDLSRKSLYSLDTEDLEKKVQRVLGKRHKGVETTSFSTVFMFGKTTLTDLQKLARELFELFRVPLMRVVFEKKSTWRIASIKPLGIQDLSEDLEDDFSKALDAYLSKRWTAPKQKRQSKYDLAILHDPKEEMPPSDSKALNKFIQAASKLGMGAELITRKDFGRLSEFDALFIRETTSIDHHTYRFSRKAASEGMVVIDDPDSILRCTNKIYLAELLKANRVPTPKTVVVRDNGLDELEKEIPYPIVLKVPDGSFSRGVFKVGNRHELEKAAKRLFSDSDLLLGQAYTYTSFDWRVGIINREPLFVCKYFMSKDHWQIYDHGDQVGSGDYQTFAIDDVPPEVVECAVKAANLIGDGFYGVDLKQIDNNVVIIEVNDNPSIESDVEDQVLGDTLYKRIMEEFLLRIEKMKSGTGK